MHWLHFFNCCSFSHDDAASLLGFFTTLDTSDLSITHKTAY